MFGGAGKHTGLGNACDTGCSCTVDAAWFCVSPPLISPVSPLACLLARFRACEGTGRVPRSIFGYLFYVCEVCADAVALCNSYRFYVMSLSGRFVCGTPITDDVEAIKLHPIWVNAPPSPPAVRWKTPVSASQRLTIKRVRQPLTQEQSRIASETSISQRKRATTLKPTRYLVHRTPAENQRGKGEEHL